MTSPGIDIDVILDEIAGRLSRRYWLDLTVLEALGEWGIEVEQLYPKPLTDDVLSAADIIVTMGCGDACPVLAGKRYLDWEIPDPAGQDLAAVRGIRDDIDARVRALIDDLTANGATL